MKRPILIIAIGYILGIIEGLYFKKSIVLFHIICLLFYKITCIFLNFYHKKIWKIIRYSRYLKIYLNKKIFLVIFLFSILGNLVIINNEKIIENKKQLLSNEKDILFVGKIVSDVSDKKYERVYKLEILKNKENNDKIKNSKVYIHYKVKSEKNNLKINYGDILKIRGKYKNPKGERNYKGFNQLMFYKTKGIIGDVDVLDISKIEDLKYVNLSFIDVINIEAIKLNNEIKKRIRLNFSSDISEILIGILLGDTKNISEEIIENFRYANMSHILAISGMHISFLILISILIFKKIVGKRYSYIVVIFLLIIYMFLTGFSPSIVRAGIMGIIYIISKLIYKCNDSINNISISCLIILLYNPYLILNLGFQLSFSGALGIILFQNIISKILFSKSKKIILEKFREIFILTISAQILILPISIYNFNIFQIHMLFLNFILGIVITPIMLINFIYLFLILINFKIAKKISFIVEFGIRVLIKISNIWNVKNTIIYISTPNFIQIIIYFIIVFFILIWFYLIKMKKSKKFNNHPTIKRMKNLKEMFKFYFKFRLNDKVKKKIFISINILIINIFILEFYLIPNSVEKNLKIHFVDVGQGDCSFIETPQKKTILIDGGGNRNYDIGKNILIPYILDRGYTVIDFVVISHFDIDHVGGILTLIKDFKVRNVIFNDFFYENMKNNKSESENLKNYLEFLRVIKEKNVNVIKVEKGDRIIIEENIFLDFLWPTKNLINEKIMNNNSIVMIIKYYNFKILFTGDIEEIAENKIVEEYNKNLKSDILKIAHHGSKSSTKERFLKFVNPRIALIGVGEDNLFKHPSLDVINLLKDNQIKIFRTDRDGEITINVSENGNYKVETNKDK